MKNNKNEMVITKSVVMALVIPVIHKMKIEFPAYKEHIKIINNIAEDDRFKVNLGNDITLRFNKSIYGTDSWNCAYTGGYCSFVIARDGVRCTIMPSSISTCQTCTDFDIIRLRWFFTKLIKCVNEWATDTRFPNNKWAIGINGSPNIGVDETGHFVVMSSDVVKIIDETASKPKTLNNAISSKNKEEDNNMKNKKTLNAVEKSCKAKIRQFIGDRVIPLVNNFIETNCVWNHRRYTTPNHNENWWKILGVHGHLIEFGFEFLEYPDKLRFYMRNIWGEKINYFMWEYPYRIIKTHPMENGSLMSDLFEYFNQVMIKTDIKSEYRKFLSSTDLEQEIIKLTIKSVLGSNPVIDIDEHSDTADHIIPKKEHDEPSEEEIQKVLDASYPLCVIKDKYGGTYSDGKYTAWICGILYIPDGVFKDDITCSNTWRELKESRKNGKVVYGIGKTPDEALNDLAKTIIRNFKEE